MKCCIPTNRHHVRNNLQAMLRLVTGPMTAAVHAWNSDFKGDAANALINIITDLLSPTNQAYARAMYIINSSGTGKSRMVDEISRTIITVPMCLRRRGSQGATIHPCLQFPVIIIWIYRVPTP